MAYNNGETLTLLWLNRYVDVQEDQQPWVEKEIAALFQWHRHTELPAYVDLLQKAQQRVQRPVTEEEVRADYAVIRSRSLRIVEHSLPALADLALALRPEQLTHLEKKIASNKDDYRRENLRGDLEQRQRVRFKKALKQAEYFFGELSKDQEERLRSISDARPLNNELVLKARQRRQHEMLAMLRKINTDKPPREAVIQMLRRYVEGVQDHFGNAEHKAFYRAYEAATVRQVTDLFNHLTPEQKQHFTGVLQHWIDDFRRLARMDG